MGTVAGYYTDWKNWLPIMENPSLYFSTPPVNLIQALAEAVRIILSEGLENRFASTKELRAASAPDLTRWVCS